ncbi:uncharacterized protein METZ01_LOCUS266059 [marine metagenome]|uniref:Uncharacterized protein n=1 Tax=marine metagenome TaxID=408172 RepID=A0A382JNE1_9ZZZZ
MANKDAAFGFRAIGGTGSSYETQGTSKYQINDNWTNAIFQGDLVGMGDGTVTDRAGTASVAGYIFGSIAATTLNLGVFNGCFYIDPTTSKPTWKNYYPGAVNITTGLIDAYCYDNPQQLYEVQTSGTLTQSDVGSLIDQGTYAAGSTINGHSVMEIGGTSGFTTAQFRIVRLSGDPSNSDTGNANSNWIVRLNESIYYNSAILS